jgi:hypothetical protein
MFDPLFFLRFVLSIILVLWIVIVLFFVCLLDTVFLKHDLWFILPTDTLLLLLLVFRYVVYLLLLICYNLLVSLPITIVYLVLPSFVFWLCTSFLIFNNLILFKILICFITINIIFFNCICIVNNYIVVIIYILNLDWIYLLTLLYLLLRFYGLPFIEFIIIHLIFSKIDIKILILLFKSFLHQFTNLLDRIIDCWIAFGYHCSHSQKCMWKLVIYQQFCINSNLAHSLQ